MSLKRWRPGQNLDRWDSFGTEIGNLRHEMDRLFSHFMTPGYDIQPGESTFPSAELQEKDESFVLKLEVPGMKPDDIEIQVTSDTVSIKGERKTEEKVEEEGMTRSEFHYGRFSRTIALPRSVKPEEVAAEYSNGILMLTMPKQDQEEHKAVKVEVKQT